MIEGPDFCAEQRDSVLPFLDHRAEAHLAATEGVLRGDAIGDVAQRREVKTGRHVGDRAEVEDARRPIVSTERELPPHPSRRDEGLEARRGVVFARSEVGYVLADELVAWHPKELAGRSVRVDVHPVVVDEQQGVERAVEDRPQERPAVPQLFLRRLQQNRRFEFGSSHGVDLAARHGLERAVGVAELLA